MKTAFDLTLLNHIPTPTDCINQYVLEAVQDISRQLRDDRKAHWQGSSRDGLHYEDVCACGKRIADIFKAKGFTVDYTKNSPNNYSRWCYIDVTI